MEGGGGFIVVSMQTAICPLKAAFTEVSSVFF